MLKDTTREAEVTAEVIPRGHGDNDRNPQAEMRQLEKWLPPPKKAAAFARIRTLHGLLKVALDDFEAVLARPDVVIDMGHWVAPKTKGRCAVCLAGSVMYRQYGIRSVTTEEDMGLVYGPAVERRLLALNELRMGHVALAWNALHNAWGWGYGSGGCASQEAVNLTYVWAPELHRLFAKSERMSPTRARAFLGEMRILQKDLKTAGL